MATSTNTGTPSALDLESERLVREGHILPLLPGSGVEDMGSYGPILMARDACERAGGDPEDVGLVQDIEAQATVVEIMGERTVIRGSESIAEEAKVDAAEGRIVFHVATHMPILTLHIRNMKKSVALILQVADEEHKKFLFKLSNMQSSTVVQGNECTAPLTLSEGWNNVSIDLQVRVWAARIG